MAKILEQYPAAVVADCCNPIGGLSAKLNFFSLKDLTDWLEARMAFYHTLAAEPPSPRPRFVEGQYSDEHRQSMIQRFQALLHGLFSKKEDEDYVRPVGPFERVDDEWNRRRPGRPQPKPEGQGA